MNRETLVYILFLLAIVLDLVMALMLLAPDGSYEPLKWLAIAMAISATSAIVIKEER